MAIKITPHQLSGGIAVPPSKSMAHRAIICASLAQGRSVITNQNSLNYQYINENLIENKVSGENE